MMQDVSRGFTSACRRACLSAGCGTLVPRGPLFTISMVQSAMTVTTVASYTHSIPMRILSMAGSARAHRRTRQ